MNSYGGPADAYFLGTIWNAPNTLIGLTFGYIGVLGGGDVSYSQNEYAVEFTNHPLMFGAITIGHTICYGKDFGPGTAIPEGTVRDHEIPHTGQGQVLGPAYLLFHAEAGIYSWLTTFDWINFTWKTAD